MRSIRNIAALIVSIFLFGLVPIYGLPFSGCAEYGFRTFIAGCSAWPEFMRGFIFIISLMIISAHKKLFTIFGLAAVILVVLGGGTGLIFTVQYTEYFQNNILDVAQHLSSPLLLGAFSALFVYIVFVQVTHQVNTNEKSA